MKILVVLALICSGVFAYMFFEIGKSKQELFLSQIKKADQPLDELLKSNPNWQFLQFGSCGTIEKHGELLSTHLQFMDKSAKSNTIDNHFNSFDFYFKELKEILKSNLEWNPDCNTVELTLIEDTHYLVVKFLVDSNLKFTSLVGVENIAK